MGLKSITSAFLAVALVTTSSVRAETAAELYDNYCSACHNLGVAGAPRLSDSEAWQSRIKQGNRVLYEHAINGFTGESGASMPPKGGFVDLTDEQVKMIVEHMISKVQ